MRRHITEKLAFKWIDEVRNYKKRGQTGNFKVGRYKITLHYKISL
jgi:hypothetical protein